MVQARVIEVLADLVLEEPRQFAVDEGLVRVEAQTVIPQEFQARFDIAPAVRVLAGTGLLKLDRDIIRQVPGLHEPHLDEMRLEFSDPICQLGHLEELILILQVGGPHPEHIGNQPAEAPQRYGGEGEHRRSIFEWLHPRQAEAVPVVVERVLHRAGAHQQRADEH